MDLLGIGEVLSFSDNLDSLAERLFEKIIGMFSWEDAKLARDVQQIVFEGQMERIRNEVDPQGRPWKANDPEYKARKGGKQIGELTGEMIAPENIFGTVRETKTTITIRYAGSTKARRKLGWFEAGGRPLWGLDDSIKAKIKERVREHVFSDMHKPKNVYVR